MTRRWTRLAAALALCAQQLAAQPTPPTQPNSPSGSPPPPDAPPLPLDGPPPGEAPPLPLDGPPPVAPAAQPSASATPSPAPALRPGPTRSPAAPASKKSADELKRDRQWVENEYEGRRCTLEEDKAPPRLTDDFDPFARPDADPPPAEKRYRPTEDAVFTSCGGLGCIDDPNSDVPTHGICALPRSVEECAGAGDPAEHGGLCGPAHVPLPPIVGIHAQRFMFTGTALAEFLTEVPDKDAGVDVAAGALYQLSFTKSKATKREDGGYDHTDLPIVYLHAEAFVSTQRVGHDVGVVFKLPSTIVTRVGVAAFGQGWGPVDFLTDNSYHIGPSAHVEFLRNLIVRAALPYWGTGPGPRLVFSVTYAAGLLDDFQ